MSQQNISNQGSQIQTNSQQAITQQEIDFDQFQDQHTSQEDEDQQSQLSGLNNSQLLQMKFMQKQSENQEQQQENEINQQSEQSEQVEDREKAKQTQESEDLNQEKKEEQKEVQNYDEQRKNILEKLNAIENEMIDQRNQSLEYQVNQNQNKQMTESEKQSIFKDIQKTINNDDDSMTESQQKLLMQNSNNININTNNASKQSANTLNTNTQSRLQIQSSIGDISMGKFQDNTNISSRKSENSSEKQFNQWVDQQNIQKQMSQSEQNNLNVRNVNHSKNSSQSTQKNQKYQEEAIPLAFQTTKTNKVSPSRDYKKGNRNIKLKDLCQEEKIKIGKLIEKLAAEKEEKLYFQQTCQLYQMKYDDILQKLQEQNEQSKNDYEKMAQMYQINKQENEQISKDQQLKIAVQNQKLVNLEQKLASYQSQERNSQQQQQQQIDSISSPKNRQLWELKQDIRVLSSTLEYYLEKESKIGSCQQSLQKSNFQSTYRSNLDNLGFSELKQLNSRLGETQSPQERQNQFQRTDYISEKDPLSLTEDKIGMAKSWVQQKKQEIDEMIRSLSPQRFSQNNQSQLESKQLHFQSQQLQMSNQVIGYVNIYVQNISQSVLFYTKVLKFEVVYDRKHPVHDKKQRTVFLKPQAKFNTLCPMIRLGKIENKDQISRNVVLALYSDNFWEDYKLMLKSKVKILGQPVYNQIFDSMTIKFQDNNGNRLELIEQSEQSNNNSNENSRDNNDINIVE